MNFLSEFDSIIVFFIVTMAKSTGPSTIDWVIKQVFPGDCWTRMAIENDFLNSRF